jgi:hypothetical protein
MSHRALQLLPAARTRGLCHAQYRRAIGRHVLGDRVPAQRRQQVPVELQRVRLHVELDVANASIESQEVV